MERNNRNFRLGIRTGQTIKRKIKEGQDEVTTKKKIEGETWLKIITIPVIFIIILLAFLFPFDEKEKIDDSKKIEKLSSEPILQNPYFDFKTEVVSCKEIEGTDIYIATLKRSSKKTGHIDYINVLSLKSLFEGELVEAVSIIFIKNIYGYKEEIVLIL